MFEGLSSRFEGILRKVRGKGRLGPEDVEEFVAEVRVALLEADVHLDVVQTLLDRIRDRAVGVEVAGAHRHGSLACLDDCLLAGLLIRAGDASGFGELLVNVKIRVQAGPQHGLFTVFFVRATNARRFDEFLVRVVRWFQTRAQDCLRACRAPRPGFAKGRHERFPGIEIRLQARRDDVRIGIDARARGNVRVLGRGGRGDIGITGVDLRGSE